MTKRGKWIGLIVGLAAVIAVAAFLLVNDGDGAEEGFVAGYRLTDDPRVIIVVVTTGPHDEIVDSRADEEDQRVIVTVRVRGQQGDGRSLGFNQQTKMMLNRPLGDRQVVGSDGRVLSQLPS